ncbi:sensor histidine kinase [Dyadobacter linearis]|uniref:sensor histidine kinase n=1 Tax=Dyadobacter linearis TaxID=2823330 RepID=UPI001BFC34ED|nr:histidine kinase [Dyadobacter sp. CECT 9623]
MNKLHNLLILVALGVLAALAYLILTSPKPAFYLAALLWIVGATMLLWLGNRYISRWLNQNYPWADYDSRRFYVQIFLSTVYSLLCVNLTYYLIKTQLTGFAPDQEQIMVLNLYGLILTIPVLSIHLGVFFMLRWKKNFTYSQELQSQNLRSQFESLKNHLAPHFLFNNLNILSSLIEKDKALAQTFLDHFSDVYRYVLRTNNLELVSLKTELEFIDSYIFMLKIRFMQQIQIRIQVGPGFYSYQIPPLSLQTLVENAIKHNKASETQPLYIEIYTNDQGYLFVKNNRQLKKRENYNAGSGLKNLAKRYAYAAKQNLEILDNTTDFIVKLPLVKIEKSNAHYNH